MSRSSTGLDQPKWENKLGVPSPIYIEMFYLFIIYLLLLSPSLSALDELSFLHLLCLLICLPPLFSTLFYCTRLIILSLKLELETTN